MELAADEPDVVLLCDLLVLCGDCMPRYIVLSTFWPQLPPLGGRMRGTWTSRHCEWQSRNRSLF
jgi:hypothetical protein